MTGEILSKRIDIAALRLKPLLLKNMGLWNPKDEYWGSKRVLRYIFKTDN